MPVVEDVETRERPGGAALAAVIAAAATVRREVVLVAPLADDDGADRLRALLDGRVRLLRDPGHRRRRRSSSGCASATTPSRGSTAATASARPGALPDEPRRTRSAEAGAVLVADYGRGTTAARRRPRRRWPRPAGRWSGTRTRAAPTRCPAPGW